MFQHNPGSPVGVGGSSYPTHTNKHRGRPAPGGRNDPPPLRFTARVTGNKNHLDINGLLDAASRMGLVGSVDLHVDGSENALRLGSASSRTRTRGRFPWKGLTLVVEVAALALTAYSVFGPC
ncbi:hypothetical protein ACTVBU_10765 [Sanguibacter sp. A246]|uniref:hypothetical protein n=1 Tax=Sanguibacter sp. A246 TaxID=3457326 RepID=UPI003FD703B7